MPQLDPTWFTSQLFWLAVCFALLYTLLAVFVLPPLQAILLTRDQSIKGDLEQAEQMKQQADHARLDYERTLADSRERAQQSIANAMNKQKTKMESDGKAMDKKIEQMLDEASARITSKKEELISGLTPTTSDLVSVIVEKLVANRPTSEQVNKVLVELSKGKA